MKDRARILLAIRFTAGLLLTIFIINTTVQAAPIIPNGWDRAFFLLGGVVSAAFILIITFNK